MTTQVQGGAAKQFLARAAIERFSKLDRGERPRALETVGVPEGPPDGLIDFQESRFVATDSSEERLLRLVGEGLIDAMRAGFIDTAAGDGPRDYTVGVEDLTRTIQAPPATPFNSAATLGAIAEKILSLFDDISNRSGHGHPGLINIDDLVAYRRMCPSREDKFAVTAMIQNFERFDSAAHVGCPDGFLARADLDAMTPFGALAAEAEVRLSRFLDEVAIALTELGLPWRAIRGGAHDYTLVGPADTHVNYSFSPRGKYLRVTTRGDDRPEYLTTLADPEGYGFDVAGMESAIHEDLIRRAITEVAIGAAHRLTIEHGVEFHMVGPRGGLDDVRRVWQIKGPSDLDLGYTLTHDYLAGELMLTVADKHGGVLATIPTADSIPDAVRALGAELRV